MTIDERISSELRRHVPEVDERVAWDRIRSAVPAGRRSRTIRLVTVPVAAAGLLLVGSIVMANLFPVPGPLGSPQSPFAGNWVTVDGDGSTLTMTIEVSPDGTVEIVIFDDFASVCSGAPSTMTGTGRLEGTELVIPTPVLTCDDGSVPEALSGPPLEEQLRNLTFALDPQAITLSDSLGSIWTREGAEDPTMTFSADAMWPQSSLEEAQEAQRLADAGDPDYAWQVDAQLAGDDYVKWERLHNGDVELVDRFLRDVLGWEAYIQNGYGGGADHSLTDQRFLRCAPGRTNSLYPPQPDWVQPGQSCAPTLDELTYESVSFNLVQPDRQGPSGIWVVSNWRPTTFSQADPAVAEAQATERLEQFLAARIAGQGAEGYVDVYADWIGQNVPLLYATASGATYERYEFERVDGPHWPYGGYITFLVRLFADDDAIVVKQEIHSHWDGGRSVGIEGGLELGGVTTENGEPVPMPFETFDGEITFSAPDRYWIGGRTIRRAEGLIDFTDPVVFWSECADGEVPADAAAFAQAVVANPNFETTAPVAALVGSVEAVAIDVALSPLGRVCLAYRTDVNRWIHALEPGMRLRLLLVDLPEGMSMRILAITVIAPEASFEEVIQQAKPIIDSIEFHPGG